MTQRKLSPSLDLGVFAKLVPTSTVKTLLERFSKYTAGDTSAIPVDLLGTTFRTVGAVLIQSIAEDGNELLVLGHRAYRYQGI